MFFDNREEAGKKLAVQLKKFSSRETIVLALPRGGVPVAFEISRALGCPMEIGLAKKIGHPVNEEFAIGAVTMNEHFILSGQPVSENYVVKRIDELREKLKLQYKKYKGDASPMSLKGKNVIIVDDGIATGATVMAMIAEAKKQKAAKIIVAAPVAPGNTLKGLKELCDEVVVLASPKYFMSVGQFYEDFCQVDDEEVKVLLQRSMRTPSA